MKLSLGTNCSKLYCSDDGNKDDDDNTNNDDVNDNDSACNDDNHRCTKAKSRRLWRLR